MVTDNEKLAREYADKELIDVGQIELFTAALTAAYNSGVDDCLKGVEREQKYHEYIEEQQAETRHPILACREIAGYCRALKKGES